MGKYDFDIVSYSNIMEKYFDGIELSKEEKKQFNNIYYVKDFYKTIADYTKHSLDSYPFYDNENDSYYYIVLYNEKYYKISCSILESKFVKERIFEIPVLEEYETITDLNTIIDHELSKKNRIKISRKRSI